MSDHEDILNVLASPIRREILWLTWSEELSAGEIAQQFEVSQPTISQHLKILREADLIAMTVDGNFRRYRARHDRLSTVEPLLRHDEVERWVLSEALEPAGDGVSTETAHLARVRVDLPVLPDIAFDLCVQAEHLERWCGTNARSEPRSGGRFQFDLMGRTCRGVYWRFHRPSMLVLHWGFAEEGEVPAPHDLFESTLFFSSSTAGTQIEVQQPAVTSDEVEFMALAWADRFRSLKDLT